MALARGRPRIDTDGMVRSALPLLVLLACKPSQPSQIPQAPTSDGVPVYEVRVTDKGFEPGRIEVPPAREVVLRFTRKVADSCADAVLVQGDPVKHMLPQDRPIDVRLTSPRSGQVRFACGMDMYRGAVVVTGG
jgi:plastocyanin domain-containing protein